MNKKKYYPKSKANQQQQIENLLKVYEFLGNKNRKKPIPSQNPFSRVKE